MAVLPSARRLVRGLVALAASVAVVAGGRPAVGAGTSGASPIQHVVLIYLENHSFDNVLGALCVTNHRCRGATTGKLPDGTVIPLSRAPDIVPDVNHDTQSQQTAIDGGKMDGFAKNGGCRAPGYACYSQYEPALGDIPNLSQLALTFAISDRTFSLAAIPSFGAHLELVTTNLDGFTGNNPHGSSLHPHPKGVGWGCDSYLNASWRASPSSSVQRVPSCVPDPSLGIANEGAYEPTPVQWVPTLMDNMDTAGASWRIYEPPTGSKGYGWAICPTFADCLDTAQAKNMRPNTDFTTDATNGSLPQFSVYIPDVGDSEHNGYSMTRGDNNLGSIMGSIMNGKDWSSTALFITYDDCGCFYDHAPPPAGRGIRVPMVIVSPCARRGFTDHTRASFASILRFVEETFPNITPLGTIDQNAYDYSASFDYTNCTLGPVPMVNRPVPAWESRYIRAHPDRSNDQT